MIAKLNKPLIFASDLYWPVEGQAIVSSPGNDQKVSILTTTESTSHNGEWSAEQLLLSAMTSSLLNGYIEQAKKTKFELAGFECSATGQVDFIDGRSKFTFIHIYPKAYVTNIADIEKAELALLRAMRSSAIFNSMNAEIVQHPEVVVAKSSELFLRNKKLSA